jgi:hypothetical protein
MFDDDIVHEYWEHWRRSRGDRADRLEAEKGSRARDVVYDAVQAGDPAVIELLAALAEAAPSEEDAGLVGAGPLEDLLSVHGARLARADGSALLEAIDTAARRSVRFRRALRSAYMGDEIPVPVKQRLGRFFRTETP